MNQSVAESTVVDGLFVALARLASLQRQPIDRLALQEAAAASSSSASPASRLQVVAEHLQLNQPKWRRQPDAADLPALVFSADSSWQVLKAQNADGLWVVERFDSETQQWSEHSLVDTAGHQFANITLVPPFKPFDSPVLALVSGQLKAERSKLIEGFVGGMLLTFLGVLVSFYTMQVYDRVIPTGAHETLLVLTLGILLVIIMEYAAKRLRSRVYEAIVDAVDQRLARTVYLKFLSIRLDQLPSSVGTLASQLRGYETVRGFLISLASQLAVDAPFALVFVAVIGFIAGPLAFIPLLFLVVALLIGSWHGAKIRGLAERNQETAHLKTGLLVETVEAAEIIKSGQGGWRMLGRWLASSDEARNVDLETRRLSEAGSYRVHALQQVSYVSLVAFGALLASQGELTMGAIIACSILSARVFNPATQLSNQLTQWAHVKAALKGLDAIWALPDDHHGMSQPVHVESVRGEYQFEQVVMRHQQQLALQVPQLNLHAGEKIAIVGPVGAGKSTLLRLLSGMYKPTEGRVLLDGVDIAQINKPKLAEQIGYLPQDGRLLGGTLRDNLTLGLPDPGDETIIAAARATGLYDAVIAPHPQGLQMVIHEGGTGLSGGQRQLVNLTRVFLRQPRIWLLDEPTASLDRAAEAHIIRTLKQAISTTDMLILVTHKTELLQLVDRIIVVAKQQLVFDGPRDEVLSKMQAPATKRGNE